MARTPYKVPSVRIRLDGNIRQPCTDPREQKALDWYYENVKTRKAFPLAWGLIVAALNGEMGPRVAAAFHDGNTEEAMDALQDLIGNYGGQEPPIPDPAREEA